MKLKKAIKVIILLALLFALVAGIFAVYKYTNGLQEDFKTYYLRCGKDEILSENVEMSLYAHVRYRFDIVNTFGKLQNDVKYEIKATANKEVDFNYYVDGEEYSWRTAELDFSEFVQSDDKSFTISSPTSDMNEIMQKFYPCATEILLPPELDTSLYLFAVTVSTPQSNIKYCIKFCFELLSAELDNPSLIF